MQTYLVEVQGTLPEAWADWFNAQLTEQYPKPAGPVSIFRYESPDQAALLGMLRSMDQMRLSIRKVTLLTPD